MHRFRVIMKLTRRKKSFIETCATSDIAFLLIIYFLVIASFNINIGFLIDLPARDSPWPVLREELMRFEMDKDGKIYHEGKAVDIPQVRSIIRGGQGLNPNIAVVLLIDGQAEWQNVVSFVELAQNLNIDSFSFSLKRENL